MTNLAAIICARMSSERLPGKPLISYSDDGKPNIQCIVERVLTSRYNPKIVVATSTDKSDDPIEKWLLEYKSASNSKILFYRGSLENVVGRFDSAMNTHCPDAEYLWRVMADNPLVDVDLVSWRLDVLLRNKADVIRPLLPEPTYAAQANVWSREAWDYCAKYSTGSLLFHPGEFLYENLSQFRVVTECGPESIYYQPIRTELDTPEDLEFFKRVWKEYRKHFSSIDSAYRMLDVKDIMDWLSRNPDIVALNSHIQEKTHSTYLHGHARARNIKCEHCSRTVANKVNDRVDITCAGCGQVKSFYP